MYFYFFRAGYVEVVQDKLYFVSDKKQLIMYDLNELEQGKNPDGQVVLGKVDFFGLQGTRVVWSLEKTVESGLEKWEQKGPGDICCLGVGENKVMVAIYKEEEKKTEVRLLGLDLRECAKPLELNCPVWMDIVNHIELVRKKGSDLALLKHLYYYVSLVGRKGRRLQIIDKLDVHSSTLQSLGQLVRLHRVGPAEFILTGHYDNNRGLFKLKLTS